MKKKILAILCAITCLFACSCGGEDSAFDYSGSQIVAENVKNVILLIGDGMGPNQIKAGEIVKGEPLFMQGIPQATSVETCSASDTVTDSAAAATAMSTGTLTNNGRVGIDPNGNQLETIVDIAKRQGKSTGIITTEELTGATPMGFSSHSLNRGNSTELVAEAVASSNVDLFAGYTYSSALYPQMYVDAGYELIADVDAISDSTARKIFGNYDIFAESPSMFADKSSAAFDRVVIEAIEWLSKNENGFFLMAEGAHIDHGGHNNDIDYMLSELYAFDDTVKAVVSWASNRNDTVVIITADHETGGLMFRNTATKENFFEKYWWKTTGHTATSVNLYFYGNTIDFAELSFIGKENLIKNTDVFNLMKRYIEK